MSISAPTLQDQRPSISVEGYLFDHTLPLTQLCKALATNARHAISMSFSTALEIPACYHQKTNYGYLTTFSNTCPEPLTWHVLQFLSKPYPLDNFPKAYGVWSTLSDGMEAWILPEGVVLAPSNPADFLLDSTPATNVGYRALTWTSDTAHEQMKARSRLENLVRVYHRDVLIPACYPFAFTPDTIPTIVLAHIHHINSTPL